MRLLVGLLFCALFASAKRFTDEQILNPWLGDKKSGEVYYYREHCDGFTCPDGMVCAKFGNPLWGLYYRYPQVCVYREDLCDKTTRRCPETPHQCSLIKQVCPQCVEPTIDEFCPPCEPPEIERYCPPCTTLPPPTTSCPPAPVVRCPTCLPCPSCHPDPCPEPVVCPICPPPLEAPDDEKQIQTGSTSSLLMILSLVWTTLALLFGVCFVRYFRRTKLTAQKNYLLEVRAGKLMSENDELRTRVSDIFEQIAEKQSLIDAKQAKIDELNRKLTTEVIAYVATGAMREQFRLEYEMARNLANEAANSSTRSSMRRPEVHPPKSPADDSIQDV